MSLNLKEGKKMFLHTCPVTLPCLFLSELKSWSQPKIIYLGYQSSWKSVFFWCGLPSVRLCGWPPSPPNFTPVPVPQRCSRRSRGTQGVAREQYGCGLRVTSQPQKGRVLSSQCGCDLEMRGFSETRCNPHLRVFLPPCLIRVQYPPNEYSRSCLFCVCVCMCVWVGADGLNWELSNIPRRKPLFVSLCLSTRAYSFPS